MLIIKDLTIIDTKKHTLIEHFNLNLDEKDKIGIIGEEGNGKSTLLKAIFDRSLIEEYCEIKGTIDKGNTKIGYFEQQLSACWNESQIYEYLLKEKPDDEIEMEAYNELAVFESLLHQLSLPQDFLMRDQMIKTLSGGEKVKLRLLKLMHRSMDLLLLDEPTNDLDLETLNWLEQFLVHLELPVLFVSHDEKLLERCANKILHLEQLNKQSKCRHTLIKGTYQDYVNQRKQNYEKQLQLATKEKQEYFKKKEKLNRIQSAVHDALNDTVRNPGQGALLKKKMRSIKAIEKRFDQEGYRKVDSLEEEIHVFFEPISIHEKQQVIDVAFDQVKVKDRVLLEDVKLLVHGKDKIVITGKNGCGKSVLMKQIYEAIKDHETLRIGYMSQDYHRFFHKTDTPVTFLMETAKLQEKANVMTLLGSMNFTQEEMQHSVFDLSEGQKAKLYLLKCIHLKCEVLLLDEPTRNLSAMSGRVLTQMLKEYEGAIVAISHDRALIEEAFSSVFQVEEKRLVKKVG